MLYAVFTDGNSVTLGSVNQWSVNQMIEVSGLSLPDVFNVVYSHNALNCQTLCVGAMGKTFNDISIIPVPNILFTAVGTITIEVEGYTISVPVRTADKPNGYESECENTDVDMAMIVGNRKTMLTIRTEALTNEELEKILG